MKQSYKEKVNINVIMKCNNYINSFSSYQNRLFMSKFL